jgi:hypothetical protein
MVVYEHRRHGWVEKHIKIESPEQLEKIFILTVLTGGCVEIENDEEAEVLKRLLPWLEPALRTEAQRVICVYETAKAILSELIH